MGEQGPERRLEGGSQNEVHERDGVVYRSGGPQSATVLALLRHLEAVGFDAAPRVVEPGFSSDGREMLAYVEGESPQPKPWGDDAIVAIGELVRDLHRATATFEPPPDARWRPWFGRELRGDHPVIGHGDPGPWNILARDGMPVALIDWDYTGPVDATWDLAQVAWLNVQLHDDDIAERQGLPDAATRARQLRSLVDAYGLESDRREGFVDRMIEVAVHDAREESIVGKVTHETTSGVDESGFPVLWAVTWRVRSASWMLRHRSLLEAAVSG